MGVPPPAMYNQSIYNHLMPTLFPFAVHGPPPLPENPPPPPPDSSIPLINNSNHIPLNNLIQTTSSNKLSMATRLPLPNINSLNMNGNASQPNGLSGSYSSMSVTTAISTVKRAYERPV